MNAPPFSGGRTLVVRAAAVGALGLALTAVGGAVDGRRALFAYLTAYTYWTGIAAAALVFLMANEAAGARWYVVVRRILKARTAELAREAARQAKLTAEQERQARAAAEREAAAQTTTTTRPPGATTTTTVTVNRPAGGATTYNTAYYFRLRVFVNGVGYVLSGTASATTLP